MDKYIHKWSAQHNIRYGDIDTRWITKQSGPRTFSPTLESRTVTLAVILLKLYVFASVILWTLRWEGASCWDPFHDGLNANMYLPAYEWFGILAPQGRSSQAHTYIVSLPVAAHSGPPGAWNSWNSKPDFKRGTEESRKSLETRQ